MQVLPHGDVAGSAPIERACRLLGTAAMNTVPDLRTGGGGGGGGGGHQGLGFFWWH